jgi:Rrf2 family iron-sulfur cluster assembly transcriptional regulator
MIELRQLNRCPNAPERCGDEQPAWTTEGFKMRLSTKGRFAVTAMIDVGLHEKFAPVSLSDIALRHQVSLSYLEQIFSLLRHRELVTSVRGPGGGYRLNRNAAAITVVDIIGAVEDTPKNAPPQTTPNEQNMTQDLWDSMDAKVFEFLQSVTLRSLVLEQLAKGVSVQQKPPPNRGVFKRAASHAIRVNAPNSVFALAQPLVARI